MLNKFNIVTVCVLLTLLLSAEPLYAQKIDNLDLQFNHATGRQRRSTAVPRNGEFKFSLGSQLFNEPEATLPTTGNNSEITRIEVAENFSDLGSIDVNRIRPATPAQLTLRSSRTGEQQRFAPTITLSSSYEDNAIGPNDPSAESLSIRSESGRLRVYGELEQQRAQRQHVVIFDLGAGVAAAGPTRHDLILQVVQPLPARPEARKLRRG